MTVLPARRPTWQSRVIAYSEELSKEDQERDQRTGKANSEEQQLDRLVDELLIHTANGQQLNLTVEAHQLEAEVALRLIRLRTVSVHATESGDAAALQKLLHTPMRELWGYRTYIAEQSPFETHQGVKGAEFSRVLTVLDDEEGRHNQFSYGKFFGITPPSDTDEANLRDGKETTLDRTRRLLYVCCSRAEKDLAVVFFADDPAAAHSAISALGLFPAEDVHNLAVV